MIDIRRIGVRPVPEHRRLEHGFWNAAVPTRCVVPLYQHAGSAIQPTVSVGDTVREGMVIADSDNRLSVPIHAPIPGRVATIGTTRLSDGTTSPAIGITLAGEFDRLGRRPEPVAWREKTSAEILDAIRAGGVVCGPRSPVPAHLYLRPRRGRKEVVLLLDVAEMEPYMTADLELLVSATDEVMTGLAIAARALGTEDVRTVVGRGFARGRRAIRRHGDGGSIPIVSVPHRYPVNDPVLLKRRLFAMERRAEEHTELVVISPSTAYAVHEAVVYGKPQIERVVAVGGGAVRRPAHVRVRIGTAIAEVLEECGGLTEAPSQIIAGGTITGRVVANVNMPVVKNTAAILALRADEVHAGREEPCVGCGACTRACPVALDPILLHDLVLSGRVGESRANGLDQCLECGLCAHVCPSRIPLVETLRAGKTGSSGRSSA